MPSCFTVAQSYSLASTNFFNAMCVFVGTASSKEIFIVGFKPFCSNVHTPFVPLVNPNIDCANQECF